MSFIISDESGTSSPTHARDAWGWPREERPEWVTQPASPSPRAHPVFDSAGSWS
jgi:hypothetical protein